MITIRPVVLAGTETGRLHPLSQPGDLQKFKTFLDMDSPFQDTLERVSDAEFLNPLVLTTKELAEIVTEQCDDIAFDVEEVILLEDGFDMAKALSSAAQWSQARGEDYPLLMIPADHFIADQGAFLRAVIDGANTALRGFVVCFGVVADWASVDQAYLEVGPRLDAGYSGHHIKSVTVAPRAKQAVDMIEARRYVWHAGMICLTPEMALKLNGLDLEQIDQDQLCVVSLLTAWADLGTWPGIWKALSLIEI